MKLDVSRVLLSVKTEPIKINGTDTDCTLKWVAVEGLVSQSPNETLAATEKVERFRLAQKVEAAESTVELTIEELAKIKDVIGKAFPISVVGAAWELIERQS